MKALAMRALFLAIVISMTLAGCRSTGDGDPATQAREIRMPGEHALRIDDELMILLERWEALEN